MDVHSLAVVLQGALRPNPDERKAAEESLNQFQFTPQHLVRMLQIIVDVNCDMAVRQVASIHFKNFIAKNWSPHDPDEQSKILPGDKDLVRQNILVFIAQVPPLLRVQLGECLKTIILADYPEQWPSLLHWVKHNLQDQQVYGALFVLRILSRKYEFKSDEERAPVYHIVGETFPHLLGIFNRLVQISNPSIEVADLIKLICKIFWSSIYLEIPKQLFDPNVFNAWMVLFLNILERPVPLEGQPADPDLRKSWGWWKVKKWTVHILNRLYTRFGDLKLQNPENRAFAQMFQKNFAGKILECYLNLLNAIRVGGYLPDRVTNLILQYLSNSVSKSNMYNLLQPRLDIVLFEIIFPLMCFNDDDKKLWDEDPHEYVRKGYDIIEDLYSPRTAAMDFVSELVRKRGKENLQKFILFIVEIFKRYDEAAVEYKPYRQKDGALLAIGALCDKLKQTEPYKSELERMLVQHVFPEFSSPVGHLRAKAAWVAGQYAHINFSDTNNFRKALQSVVAGMRNQELPVRVDSVFALRSFVEACKDLSEIRPILPQLLDEFFKLMNEVENEDLVFTLETIVDKFGEEMAPYALGLCQNLAAAFWKCMNSAEADDEADDPGALAAVGCLRAISTILESVSRLPHLFVHIEPTLLPIMRRMLTTDGQEVFEEVLEIVSYMTFFSPTISMDMWTLWPLMTEALSEWAINFFPRKRPRDLLNPKPMKYMQAIFSIKDATSKRESRDISALFGVTATQVREFFTGQRSRVRRFIRLSREKAVRSNACKNELEEPLCSDPNVTIDSVPLNMVCPAANNEGPSCSTQDEVLPGMDDLDKHFVENIFILMRKEEKFSGQVKLMEWILQIQNASVLHWFLTKGGVMILATWLSQAAVEEQTTILHVIIKVLCHLPLHKALPAHMSAILQSVNKLRFYRSSDIANRAKVLLSKWSKIFARSQTIRKPNAMKSSTEVQDEMLLKQSIGEIMGNESWETKSDNHQENSTQCYADAENLRKLESSQPLKLLTSSADDSNKKFIRGSSSQTRERRKVQLVEQPGQKATGRSSQVARPVPVTQGRPLSADDIQKAKMRAQFMQSKYGKIGMTSDGGPNKGSSPQVSVSTSASSSYVHSKAVEIKKPVMNVSSELIQQVAPIDNKINLDLDEPLWKQCKRVQILWQTPPEMRINSSWMIGTGENSKEVEIQNNRIRREREIIYKTVKDIPPNPKEPWDREMDYDDSLTPEIPTEQMPDVEGTETVVSPRESEEIPVISAATTSQSSKGNVAEPDLELLAVLLKNPELVFALTSAEGGGSLSGEDTVKLLDMLKSNGVDSLGSLTGVAAKVEEKVEVSLPSPTPSSNPVTSGWRPEFAKNPFSRQSATVNGEANHMPAVMAATVQSQILTTSMVVPQRQVIVPPPVQPTISQLPLHQGTASTTLPEKRARLEVLSLNQNAAEIFHSRDKFPAGNLPLPNISAASPSMRLETLGNVNQAFPVTQQSSYPLPPVMPRPARPQERQHPSMIPEPRLLPPLSRERQGLASSPHSHGNHNNYNNAYVGGPLQARMQQPGPPRNRNEIMVDQWYESWSPDNSPIRSQPGWNYDEPRMNMGPNYRFPRPRPRNPEYRDLGRNENRRWRDQRR